MDKSKIREKLRLIIENPGVYKPLTAEEQAAILLEIMDTTPEDTVVRGGGTNKNAVQDMIDRALADLPGGGGDGVTDHGALTGLSDDDHTQYHTDARGDARYYTQAQLNAGQLDTRYFTESEVTSALAGKADTTHTHTKSDITDFSDLDYADAVHSHIIGDVTGLQAALDGKADDAHSHAISDVTGLGTALDGKSNTGHTHIISEVTGLQTSLNSKLESVTLADITNLTVGTTAPVSPSVGDLWVDTN